VGASGISDHWKEKAMGAYARTTFSATFLLALLIAAVIGVAGALIFGFEAVGLSGFFDFMLTWQGILFTIVAASAYAWLRGRLFGSKTDATTDASNYSPGDKMLHQMALGSPALANLAFNIDQRMAKPKLNATQAGRHVFVSGLARAGTTVLMRRFHASGAFRSLTYRDMPLVLAPNLWRRLGGGKSTATEAKERAHGDNLKVNEDSPESLDEVFWRMFDGQSYITRTALSPHRPGKVIATKFASYVGAILSRSGKDRYLSKNNNNILRLLTIRETFPNALILVPFRDPFTHAGSLLKQHQRFLTMQGEDDFVLTYMDWLAHHEFGRGHRPFRFSETGPNGDPGTLDYWVDLWNQTYGWLLENAPADAVFVCYETLCKDPAIWNALAERAGVDPDVTSDGGFALAAAKPDAPTDVALGDKARALYDKLTARSAEDIAGI
jgi:hypothetical protein